MGGRLLSTVQAQSFLAFFPRGRCLRADSAASHLTDLQGPWGRKSTVPQRSWSSLSPDSTAFRLPSLHKPPWQRQVQTWGHYSIGSDIHSLGRGECDEDKLLPLPSLQILQSTCTGSSMGYRARRRYCCKGSPLHTPSSEICCVHFIQRGKGPWQVSNSEMKMNIRL